MGGIVKSISNVIKPVASIAGPVLSAGGGLIGSVSDYIGGNQARKGITNRLLDATYRSEGALEPFRQTGTTANSQLGARLSSGFNPTDLTNEPGYQLNLNQGLDAINKQLAASGLVGSGRAIKAAQDYSQGLAERTYNDAFNRWAAQNQQLSGLSGQGLSSVNSLLDVYDDQGNIRANDQLQKYNQRKKLTSDLMGNLGMGGSGGGGGGSLLSTLGSFF